MSSEKSYQTMKAALTQIGREYRNSKRRMDLSEIEHIVSTNRRQYNRDAEFVTYIDRMLKDCNEQTRFIIRNEYLNNNDPEWYKPYYSQSAFYRRKKQAVEQFGQTLKY